MKKLLIGILMAFAISKMFADVLIKQFKITDSIYPSGSGGNVWIVTAMAIDGEFPSNALIIDAFCEKFRFKGAQGQVLYINLVANKIAKSAPLYLIQGIALTAFGSDIFANANTSSLVPGVQFEVYSHLPTDEYGQMSIHTVYQ